MAYDDPKYGIKETLIRDIPYNNNSAAEVQCRIQFFKNVKLLNVRAIPRSTGFDATDTIDVFNDDGAIGQIGGLAGTTTFGDIETMSTNTLVNATSSLEIQQSTAAAAGCFTLMVQYQGYFEGA
jgi:hypothetical protein